MSRKGGQADRGRVGGARGRAPPALFLIAGIGISIALWLFSAVRLSNQSDALPAKWRHTGKSPLRLFVAFGDDWTVYRAERWWGETAEIEFGRSAAKLTDEKGAPVAPPFPMLPGRPRLMAIKSDFSPHSLIYQVATGWPLRVWISRAYKRASDSRMREESQILWLNSAASIALASAIGATGAIGGWVLVRASVAARRRSRGRCPECGYAREGLSSETRCPECGRANERRPARKK